MDYNLFNYSEFLFEKNSQWDYPLQIIMRGNIGLTSKAEDFTMPKMKHLYDNYIRMILIKGESGYNDDPKLPDNRKLKVDFKYPILNFASTKHSFMDEKKTDIYNKFDAYPIAADKNLFYKTFEDSDFVPNAVYKLEDIEDLKLPIIAKPENGFSAQGIEKFDTYEDAKKSKMKFDNWSEGKDLVREFRAFVMENKTILISERITNSKSDMSVGKKKPDEKIDLIYIDQDMENFEHFDEVERIRKEMSKHIDLDFYNIDLMLDKDGKMWVPEINGAPGIGPSMFYDIYKAYVKMVYKKDLSPEVEKELKDMRDLHRKEMSEEYPKEFKFSLNPIK